VKELPSFLTQIKFKYEQLKYFMFFLMTIRNWVPLKKKDGSERKAGRKSES